MARLSQATRLEIGQLAIGADISCGSKTSAAVAAAVETPASGCHVIRPFRRLATTGALTYMIRSIEQEKTSGEKELARRAST
jgi:hypothetical protein